MKLKKERVASLQTQPQVNHSGSGKPINSFSNFDTKLQKFLIILNRDTGQILPVEVTTPIEYVPFGFYALRYIGTKNQIDKLISKFHRNPSLLEKYTDL